MRRILFAATAGAMALVLAACGDRTGESAETAPAATEEAMPDEGGAAADAAPGDEWDDSAYADEAPADEMSETADMGDLACVKDVPADSVCLMDINACGFSSGCNCGDGYEYNAALGKCLLVLDGVGQATPVEVGETDCAKAASGMCTRDINACGQPSNCACEDGFVWNDVAGKCLRDLTSPAE